MKRILVPAVTTLLVVVSLVALSGWNRSSGPRLAITLTERELTLPWNASDEGVPLQLALQIERRAEPLDARNWLPDDRLRQIGFNLDVPFAAPDALHHYGRALPRVAWVAFEYDGEAWRAIDRRRALAPREPWRSPLAPTRLVPIDLAPDLDPLLERYPRGHVMLRAIIALGYRGPRDGGPLVYGWIREIVPSRVAVPRHLRPRLTGLQPPIVRERQDGRADEPPRYAVDLALGRLGNPYITDIRLLRVE